MGQLEAACHCVQHPLWAPCSLAGNTLPVCVGRCSSDDQQASSLPLAFARRWSWWELSVANAKSGAVK